MSREADASTLRAFRWMQPSWQPDCNQERTDPQPVYFCTRFEQRHWGTLFQTTLQRFLMWTILENRGTNSLWRRGKVGLPSSLINKHLPQEQRLGGLVAGLSKRLGFPKFGVLSCASTLQCARDPPRLAATRRWLDLGGKGNQYHHEAHAIYSAVTYYSALSLTQGSQVFSQHPWNWGWQLVTCKKGKISEGSWFAINYLWHQKKHSCLECLVCFHLITVGLRNTAFPSLVW